MRDFFFSLHSIHHEDLHFEGNAIWIFSKLNIWSLPGLYSPAGLFELSTQWPGCLHSGSSFSYATFHRFRWGWWLFEELNLALFSSPRGLPPWFWLRVSVHSENTGLQFSWWMLCFSLQLSLEWGALFLSVHTLVPTGGVPVVGSPTLPWP